MELFHLVVTGLLIAWTFQVKADEPSYTVPSTSDSPTNPQLEEKQDDITKDNAKIKSVLDNTEEIAAEDLQTIIKHLKEITALRETIRSLLPSQDYYEKNVKSSQIKDNKDLINSIKDGKNGWRIMDTLNIKEVGSIQDVSQETILSEEEELEGWPEDKIEEEFVEEPAKPLTPQEQEG